MTTRKKFAIGRHESRHQQCPMTGAPSQSIDQNQPTASVRPPAKLNLFLELLANRDDGFHEIDTVMVPIDWCDRIRVRRTARPGVQLKVDWLPSTQTAARRLEASCSWLNIPGDETNLVHRALTRFAGSFGVAGGFECELLKSIPAGAGMGGASSDAAAALRCAAALSGIPDRDAEIELIAAELGSDVPFFLGDSGRRISAARALGRGEKLTPVTLASPLHVVVVFPNESLSTARVYEASTVPADPQSAEGLIAALRGGNRKNIELQLMNRLSQPAREIAPRIDEILKSMWRAGLRTCQLTGSGSACFALANSARDARHASARLRAVLQPGALVVATHAAGVPPNVEVTPSNAEFG
jgi:4-diphosphocytidyl-2-C-methyl-D-erythritol kinase